MTDSEFKYNCFLLPQTILELLEHFKAINDELKETNLENLKAFNKTYFIVSKNIAKKLGTSYFQNDSSIEKFTLQFSTYYLNAIKEFTLSRKTTPAWELLFNFCEQDSSYQWVYIMLGFNAHVNNDLAFAIVDVSEISLDDYQMINPILDQSIDEIVLSIQEESTIISKMQNKLLWSYRYMIKRAIKKWRRKAWSNAQRLKSGKIEDEEIEQQAVRVANRFMKIYRIDPLLFKE